jgi:hypothetical protein
MSTDSRALIAKLNAMKGDFLGDGVHENIDRRELLAEISRLTAELEEVRKDARRWKAVEEGIEATSGHEGEHFMLGFYDPKREVFMGECYDYAECVDAAIAAAMTKEKP